MNYLVVAEEVDHLVKTGYGNDSFIFGPQGCSTHANPEKRMFFWYVPLIGSARDSQVDVTSRTGKNRTVSAKVSGWSLMRDASVVRKSQIPS